MKKDKIISLLKQIIQFGLVGGIAFVIDYGVFALLTKVFGVHYLISQIISFVLALAFNYIASVKWVFKAKKQNLIEATKFVVLSIIGLGINELLLFVGVSKMNYEELIVKLFVTIIVMIYNFITRKIFIEERKKL